MDACQNRLIPLYRGCVHLEITNEFAMQNRRGGSNEAPDASMNGVASISSGGFRDFERTFKGAKVTHVQTEGGDTDGRFTYLAAPGLHLIRMAGAPPCIVTVEMGPDLILFSVPVSWQGRLTYDGERVTQTTFFRPGCSRRSRIATSLWRELISGHGCTVS